MANSLISLFQIFIIMVETSAEPESNTGMGEEEGGSVGGVRWKTTLKIIMTPQLKLLQALKIHKTPPVIIATKLTSSSMAAKHLSP